MPTDRFCMMLLKKFYFNRMKKINLFTLIVATFCFLAAGCVEKSNTCITPLQFKGTDTERIQFAVNEAAKTTGTVTIPAANSNGSGIWLLDSAILLPSNIMVILENCTLQLSDQCRDNMFRSSNVGVGIANPGWNENISIVGIGHVLLKGANNPRATGDGHRTLSLNPDEERKAGKWRVSYGSDAGKEGIKQLGDWRNIMVLMGYVNGFRLKNVNIENAHAWAVSFERTVNAEISDITFHCPEMQVIDGKQQFIANRDGINLRHGCKNFRINNVSGTTGDDFVAFSILGLDSEESGSGILNSTMVTTRKWNGPEDNTEHVAVTNIVCESSTRAVAIRANDVAEISNLYINGVAFKGGYNAMLVGGKGYGKDSRPGKINNIHAMNILGEGRSLIQIEEAISDCSFTNGIYTGNGDQIIDYKIDKSKTSNVFTQNLVSMK